MMKTMTIKKEDEVEKTAKEMARTLGEKATDLIPVLMRVML